MTTDRPTIRPVTLARLAEIAHMCQNSPQPTSAIEEALDITHRRARETILEASRLDLLEETCVDEEDAYLTTNTGEKLVAAIEEERWSAASRILIDHSPHYAEFLEAVRDTQPASLDLILERLMENETVSERSYNATSVDVLGDWAERLGSAQRNAFTGEYYLVETTDLPEHFPQAFLEVYDRLESVVGINLRQRYLSIPELREHFCAEHRCPRSIFDEALGRLAAANIGRVELSGAPLDTSAKDAALGIKSIERADDDGLVSTSQSTERVMKGIDQHGKRYYFLAVFDRNLSFPEETTP